MAQDTAPRKMELALRRKIIQMRNGQLGPIYISEEKRRYLQDQIHNRCLPEVRAFFGWETPRAQDSTLVKKPDLGKSRKTHMYVLTYTVSHDCRKGNTSCSSIMWLRIVSHPCPHDWGRCVHARYCEIKRPIRDIFVFCGYKCIEGGSDEARDETTNKNRPHIQRL